MRRDFAELHRQRFGYVDESAEIILDTLIVEAVARTGTEAHLQSRGGQWSRATRRQRLAGLHARRLVG